MKGYKNFWKKAESYLQDSGRFIGRRKRRNDTNAMVLALGGLAAGLIAGAILGILFAPAKGKETRTAIGNSAKDFGNNVAGKARESAERLASLKDQAVDTVKSKFSSSGTDTTVPVTT
jgi:gas vesicle protein